MPLSHRRLASIVGYLILFGYTVWLYGAGVFEAAQHHLIVMVIIGLCALGLLYESVREWKAAYGGESDEQRYNIPPDLLSFTSVFAGTIITFWISIDLGQGAVVASGLVGIFGAAFIKPYAAPLFSGSFVGMASADVFGYGSIALAGVIAGVIFVLGKHVFNGFGGKLGTIAMAGCVFSAAILGNSFLSNPVIGWDQGGLLVVYCIAGAVITFILSVWFGQGPVMASGMVGLAGGLLLPALHGGETGGLLAIGVFSASFAGMSGTNRFEKARWMVPAGVLCALIIMHTNPYLGGAGGKLGTTAFGAVIGVRGLFALAARFRPGTAEQPGMAVQDAERASEQRVGRDAT